MPDIAIIVGDIVLHEDVGWIVMAHDKQVGTFKIRNWDGRIKEVANNRSEVQFTARPSVQWSFVAAPTKTGAGHITKIVRAGVELTPIADWVPSAIGRPGGSVFFNPRLKLRVGEVLVAHHAKAGRLSRLTITPTFGTVATRRKREAAQTQEPLTINQRLLSDDSIFEGDLE